MDVVVDWERERERNGESEPVALTDHEGELDGATVPDMGGETVDAAVGTREARGGGLSDPVVDKLGECVHESDAENVVERDCCPEGERLDDGEKRSVADVQGETEGDADAESDRCSLVDARRESVAVLERLACEGLAPGEPVFATTLPLGGTLPEERTLADARTERDGVPESDVDGDLDGESDELGERLEDTEGDVEGVDDGERELLRTVLSVAGTERDARTVAEGHVLPEDDRLRDAVALTETDRLALALGELLARRERVMASERVAAPAEGVARTTERVPETDCDGEGVVLELRDGDGDGEDDRDALVVTVTLSDPLEEAEGVEAVDSDDAGESDDASDADDPGEPELRCDALVVMAQTVEVTDTLALRDEEGAVEPVRSMDRVDLTERDAAGLALPHTDGDCDGLEERELTSDALARGVLLLEEDLDADTHALSLRVAPAERVALSVGVVDTDDDGVRDCDTEAVLVLVAVLDLDTDVLGVTVSVYTTDVVDSAEPVYVLVTPIDAVTLVVGVSVGENRADLVEDTDADTVRVDVVDRVATLDADCDAVERTESDACQDCDADGETPAVKVPVRVLVGDRVGGVLRVLVLVGSPMASCRETPRRAAGGGPLTPPSPPRS